MNVIYRNGQQGVVTGWREWLVLAAGLLLAVVVVVGIVGLLLGIALTMTTIVLFALPLALGLTFLAQLVLRRR